LATGCITPRRGADRRRRAEQHQQPEPRRRRSHFKRGVVPNRLDLLSEFDVAYKQSYGLRVSAAAWYDTVYNRSNDQDASARANQSSVAQGRTR
jgi:hypothetical protein